MRILRDAIIPFILFAGFPFVDYLSSLEVDSLGGRALIELIATNKLYIYGLIMILFFAHYISVNRPKPASAHHVKTMRDVVETFLERLIEGYYMIVFDQELVVSDSIRVNLMLKTKRPWFQSDVLKVYYNLAPNWVGDETDGFTSFSYSQTELDQMWRKGEGTCGQAWEDNTMRIYDEHKYPEPREFMTEPQKKINGGLKSVLSVPIWFDQQVIGVLNFDSTDTVEISHLDKEAIGDYINEYAEMLSSVLINFKDGILLR
ncbi:MAG: GAF domain-containing protein [Chloroflexota bacterium]